ncbi:MAG TPA: CocE/NonD family hydrolase [Gemmatimonadales bacterium]|nr:CocE/NonD family hydrolase [Gemmatimonadales bacterium]
MIPSRRTPLLLLFLLLSAPFARVAAQGLTTSSYACRFVEVPVRDGVHLHTSICAPRDSQEKLPFLLTRTPYGIRGDTVVGDSYRFLAADGYIFVGQDIRGRYGSEGQWVMNRPLHDPADSAGVDESTDTYDTIDWLLKNVPNNNGRVGALGVSYPGFLATMAGINPHPAVKAVSPQAPMTDTWMGDDFFHQGAFRLSYGFEYTADLELSKDESVPLPIGTWDTYDWYLRQMGPLSGVDAKFFQGRNHTWTSFVAHPSYDAYWQARAVQRRLTAPAVPTLTVGGWWDQEDRYGPLATYRALERGDTGNRNALVMGPWNHGGWRRGEPRRMPVVDPGTSESYLRDVEAPWFAYWLKDKGKLTVPDAYLYDTGAKQWRSFDVWPPKDGTPRSLYLHAGGKASFEPPAASEAPFDQYVSDPAHPVPYRPRPVEQTYDPRGSRWRVWETEDQRFVDNRPDVVRWVSAPLDEDLTIAGDVTARLVASTTGQDADWVVKLIDVFPDSMPDHWEWGGYELMVAHEIMRGRYRKSFTTPAPLQPNTPLEFTVDLHQQAYTFKRGHKLMVQVQSTWFPLYDRNPQTWVPNIFKAKTTDYKAQTHRIWHTAGRPSRVDVTVIR